MTKLEKILSALGIKAERQRGNRIWLICPYHEDKTPTNCFIRPFGERKFQFFCFSCKNGGTIVDLVMHLRKCSHVEAKAFIEVQGEDSPPPKARHRIVHKGTSSLQRSFHLPQEVKLKPLCDWVSGARKYAETRCLLTSDEVKDFRIGYAVDGTLGGRIVFPWISTTGVISGYSARTFIGDKVRYLTPSSKEHADFGIMFGEHTWGNERNTLVVTEGAINALAVRRVIRGSGNSIVALGGSNLNLTQIIKISTFQRVVILTDSDPAGDRCARELEMSLGRSKETIRVRLSGGDALDLGSVRLREALSSFIEVV